MVLLTSIFYPLRYIRYILPIVPLLFFASAGKLRIERQTMSYFSTFLLFYFVVVFYLLVQNLIFHSISERFFPNAVFVLAPLLFTTLALPFFRLEMAEKYVKLILVVNILVFFLEEGRDVLYVISNVSAIKGAIISSELSTENHLAFVFGFLLIYFVMEKYSLWYKLIVLVFFLLCFKRIVLAAILVCIPAYWIINYFKWNVGKYRQLLVWIGVGVNLLYIKITQLLVSGQFDQVIKQYTGISSDQFLMGRKTFFSEAFDKAGGMNLWGLGLGKIDDIIFRFYGARMNLHSEILKNYFEFGLPLFLVWIFLIYSKNLFSNKSAILLLYLNILLLTDNVFIYFDIMFYFYFFILIYLKEKNATPNPLNHEVGST